ncbi:MAG: DUF4065 domain-containing protein [Tannerellaceae bacterium]|jgi:uncharacterized phage-associated protein|nr:DUF4065 domain-containing protein [Tannerellaceae bacterium]
MTHKASDIAKVFIKLADPEYGDLMSNLKLQKLLYYVQGFHLAMYDSPFFAEDILAWEYGPVVNEVYQEYKTYASGAIPYNPEYMVPEEITKEQLNLIQEVYHVYGQFSAHKLMNMTHNESPWKSTNRNGVISHQKMKDYFLTQLDN